MDGSGWVEVRRDSNKGVPKQHLSLVWVSRQKLQDGSSCVLEAGLSNQVGGIYCVTCPVSHRWNYRLAKEALSSS